MKPLKLLKQKRLNMKWLNVFEVTWLVGQPDKKTVLTMDFEGRVPSNQRSEETLEGVAASMTQWYPKMAAFDRKDGKHPYIDESFMQNGEILM